MKKMLFLIFLIIIFSKTHEIEAHEPERENNPKFIMNGSADTGIFFQDETNLSFSTGKFSPTFNFFYDEKILVQINPIFLLNETTSSKIDINYFHFTFETTENSNLSIGKFLSPIGKFRQNLSPSWINKLPSDPVGFSEKESVSPLHHIGVEFRGGTYMAKTKFFYSLFMSNGPELKSQLGSISISKEETNTDSDQNKMVGGRLGFNPKLSLELAISSAYSKVGFEDKKNNNYKIFGADLTFNSLVLNHGFMINAEYANSATSIDQFANLKESAYYLQFGHLLSPQFELVLRHAEYSTETTPSREFSLIRQKEDRYQNSIGLNYLLQPNVIIKSCYEINTSKEKDSKSWIIQIAFGF